MVRVETWVGDGEAWALNQNRKNQNKTDLFSSTARLVLKLTHQTEQFVNVKIWNNGK